MCSREGLLIVSGYHHSSVKGNVHYQNIKDAGLMAGTERVGLGAHAGWQNLFVAGSRVRQEAAGIFFPHSVSGVGQRIRGNQ